MDKAKTCEEYDPEDFKLLKDLFHLEVKGDEKHE